MRTRPCDRLSACGAGLGKPSARKGCPLQPLSKAWQCPIRSYSVHTHSDCCVGLWTGSRTVLVGRMGWRAATIPDGHAVPPSKHFRAKLNRVPSSQKSWKLATGARSRARMQVRSQTAEIRFVPRHGEPGSSCPGPFTEMCSCKTVLGGHDHGA